MISGKTKKSLQPHVVTALLILGGLFVVLQLFVDRVLTQDGEATPPQSRQMMSTFDVNEDLLRDEFFSSPFMFDSGLMEMKREMDHQRDLAQASRGFSSGSFENMFAPSYDVKEDEDKITVAVSVPDVSLKDIVIEIIDGRVMHISGGRRNTEMGGAVSEIRFDKRFALGRNVDQDNISAKLENGDLIIETPKVGRVRENNVKKIDVKQEL